MAAATTPDIRTGDRPEPMAGARRAAPSGAGAGARTRGLALAGAGAVRRAACVARLLAVLLVAAPVGPALVGALAPTPAAAQDAPVIGRVDSILVEGARRVDDATIKAYMTVVEGEPATAADINASLRRLLDTGLFEDVTISPLGSGLLVQVKEAAYINLVAFEGNEEVKDETLRGSIRSTSRSAFSRAKADRDAQTLLELYRRSGRYGATVEPVIIERDNNRVDLVFEIDEGQPTGIRSIAFVGNRAFSDRRLRSAIGTKENGLLAFLYSTGTYDPDRLEYDKELLRRHYLDRGYADFRVLSAVAELADDREDFLLTFTVDEGEVYEFGKLDIDIRIPGIDPEPLRAVFEMEEGEAYSISEVDTAIENLIFELGQRGYVFLDVRPRANKNEETRTIDVTLEASEGPRVYIERIEIVGNSRTVDRVLRREFHVAEGDAYNALEIEAARSRLRALGFFGQVDVRTERGGADDRAVVKVEVEEKLTGSISLGLGFSSSDGPGGDISITEQNFLGRGQFVQASVQVAGYKQAVQFNFEEPALLDRDLAAGFNIGYVQIDRTYESSYQETNIGFRPYLEFPVADDQRLRLKYRISSDEIRDVTRYASPAIFEDEGSALTSSIGAVWTLDRRNDVLEPTRGYRVGFDQELAGLGGDTAYTRSVASAKVWQGFLDDQLVASAEIEGGAMFSFGDDLRVSDRFYMGGDDFRGFARDGIGPRDVSVISVRERDSDGNLVTPANRINVQRDDALGGQYYAMLRTNVSFPLGLPDEFGIYGGLFADVGTVWGLDQTTYSDKFNRPDVTIDDSAIIRASIGASLFIDSPFGPLRFNFALPVVREDYDAREYFRFTIGGRF
ncbi:MAG: outer membrane protein assembly factor BamA [Rhodobacteraceae bacterium]|nr:outer membrane protein assembly factor BamA [Paracoccaceae bacterium]MBR27279.1 outer membrane protein assembly factor BamA [Paracoccaceae bacterium]